MPLQASALACGELVAKRKRILEQFGKSEGRRERRRAVQHALVFDRSERSLTPVVANGLPTREAARRFALAVAALTVARAVELQRTTGSRAMGR
jgi:hypothetical protein